jgi:hypothetical protein
VFWCSHLPYVSSESRNAAMLRPRSQAVDREIACLT